MKFYGEMREVFFYVTFAGSKPGIMTREKKKKKNECQKSFIRFVI